MIHVGRCKWHVKTSHVKVRSVDLKDWGTVKLSLDEREAATRAEVISVVVRANSALSAASGHIGPDLVIRLPTSMPRFVQLKSRITVYRGLSDD